MAFLNNFKWQHGGQLMNFDGIEFRAQNTFMHFLDTTCQTSKPRSTSAPARPLGKRGASSCAVSVDPQAEPNKLGKGAPVPTHSAPVPTHSMKTPAAALRSRDRDLMNRAQELLAIHLEQDISKQPPPDYSLAQTDGSDEMCIQDKNVYTVMVRNIPCGCNRQDVLNVVDELGFKNEYDFFYLPARRNKSLGYAFIGFPDPEMTQKFADTMTGYRFLSKKSTKIVTVTAAHVQGLNDNLKHFSHTSVMHSKRMPVFQPQVHDSASGSQIWQ